MLDGYASSTLNLARLQFAVTTSVHFLFVILTLGLGMWIFGWGRLPKLVDGGKLAEAQAQMVAQYGPGDYAPPSWTLGAFDWMTTSGNLLFLFAVAGLVLTIRDWLIRVRGLRFMLVVLIATVPVPFLTAIDGWLVRDVGRQPWAVYGVLETGDAVSDLRAGPMLASLIGFGALLIGLPLTAGGRVAGLLFGLTTGVLALVQGATFLGRPYRRPLALVAAALAVLVTLVERLGGVWLALAGLLVAALVGVALTRSLPASSVAAALPVFIVGTAVYPNFLVSTVDPAATITVAGGASGDHARQVLTIAAGPLLPLLVLAQVACWWYFRRRPSTVYW